MMKIISLKCPECGADIDIEEGHRQCFCKYCGTKILIDDGNSTYTYRKVDEARIKEAEVEKAIRLKELELELYDKKSKEDKKRTGRKRMNSITLIVVIIALALLLIGRITGNEDYSLFGYVCLLWLIPLFCFYLADIVNSISGK